MSRKHYIAIAADIKSNLLRSTPAERYRLEVLADELCITFSTDNARFNRMTFLSACGF